MQINLSPWFYRNLINDKTLIREIDYYEVEFLDGRKYFEANCFLANELRPSWLIKSEIYKDSDGTGTDKHKNIAVYKSISEGLERFAFYETIDANAAEFSFDENPSTTGMAAFPGLSSKHARSKARHEAIERWAIHQFNRSLIPVVEHYSSIPSLNHFELVTPFSDIKVSLLNINLKGKYIYGFGAGNNIRESYHKALIELERNIRVLNKCVGTSENYTYHVDSTITFFASAEGYEKFLKLIKSAPAKIANKNPKVLCDKELEGVWSKYAHVWRFLLEDSYFDCSKDKTFFMF